MIPVEKLEAVVRRHDEIDELLCDPKVLGDPRRLTSLNKERQHLSPVVAAFRRWRDLDKQIADDTEALDDPELGPLAREELPELEKQKGDLEQHIRVLLLPRDPNDEKNTILEI